MPAFPCRKMIALLFMLTAVQSRAAESSAPLDAMIKRVEKYELLNYDPRAEIRELASRGVDPRSATPALARLTSGHDVLVRDIAIRLLCETGPAWIDSVLAAYENPDPQSRVRTLKLVQQIQYSPVAEETSVLERILAIYQRAIDDQDVSVRSAAVHSLSMAYLPAEDLCSIWMKGLDSSDERVVQGCERDLAYRLSSSEQYDIVRWISPSAKEVAVKKLLKHLEARIKNPETRDSALEALGSLKSLGRPLAPVLVGLLATDDADGRRRIDSALASIAPSEKPAPTPEPTPSSPPTSHTLEALAAQAYDKDADVRYKAIDALGRAGQTSGTAERVLPALVRALGDNDYRVRAEAADALGKLGPKAAPVLPEVLKMYEANPRGIRQELINAIMRIDPHAALPLLIDGLTSFRNGYYQLECAKLLGELGPKAGAAVPQLVTMMKSGESDEDHDVGTALARIVGRGTLVQWIKSGSPDEQLAAVNALGEIGARNELPALATLKADGDKQVAARAQRVEAMIRHREFGEFNRKTLAELIGDFRTDDIAGNADRAWRSLQEQRYRDEFKLIKQTLAATTDTQQRKALAMIVAGNPMTTPTLTLLGLVNENLRSGSLAEAARAAVDWLIMAPMDPPLAEARMKLLRADEHSTDSQQARLAALVLQYSRDYKPAGDESALLAENLEEDGIGGNAELAMEVISRLDMPWKRGMLEKVAGSKDPQAAGKAAVALLCGPNPPRMNERLFRDLVANLKFENEYAEHVIDKSIELIGASRLGKKREILEAALRDPVDNKIYHRRVARLLLAMPGYKPSPAMIDHLIAQLHVDGVTGNAAEAVIALSEMRSPSVIRKLERALDSDDRQQRLWAADALPKPHDYPGGAPARLIAVLLENLDDENNVDSGAWCDDYRSFSNAKETALYLIDHPKLATRELEASLDSPVPQRRWLAAIILGSTGRARRVGRIAEILIPELRSGGDNDLAGCALEKLGKPVRPYLEKYCNDPDPVMRRNVELILGDLKRPPRTPHDRYMREDKYGLPDKDYMLVLPEYWTYQD